jgi:hypothetical protein
MDGLPSIPGNDAVGVQNFEPLLLFCNHHFYIAQLQQFYLIAPGLAASFIVNDSLNGSDIAADPPPP